MHQIIQDKQRKKVPRKQPFEKNSKFRVLQELQGNSGQDTKRKQRQLQMVHSGQSESNNSKKHEKQQKMDHINQEKFVSIPVPSKNHATTVLNSKASEILSPVKNKVTRGKIVEVLNTFPLNSLTSASDFISDDNAS